MDSPFVDSDRPWSLPSDPEAALGDDHGDPADLDGVDPLALPGRDRVEQRGPADLNALPDDDLVAKGDLTVPGEMDRPRSRSRDPPK